MFCLNFEKHANNMSPGSQQIPPPQSTYYQIFAPPPFVEGMFSFQNTYKRVTLKHWQAVKTTTTKAWASVVFLVFLKGISIRHGERCERLA